MDVLVIWLVLDLVVFGPLGAIVDYSKGRSALEGYVVGFLLGIIGVVIVAVLPRRTA